ncbi:MAG: cupin domain-containing protein [Lachnospiraceae bacterium]|nr:cupin domain-containing protein [Lachnospiraceae bacterium]
MLIDFNQMKEITAPGMNNGTGTMNARMYADENNRMICCRIHAGGSIGTHKQEESSDINYVLSGHGRAICDGKEEMLTPGTCHYCKSGQEHAIINDGDEDLVLFTVVSKVPAVSD